MSEKKKMPLGNRFSSTNQPPNESKRVPKWRKHLKERILEEFAGITDAMIDEMKNGNVQAFDKVMDRAFGKMKDKSEVNIKGKLFKVIDDEFGDL